MTQDVKNDIKKAIQVNTIPLVAIMTAVTTVLTMFVKIPTPTRLCDLCVERTEKGQQPFCVHHCLAGVMQWGTVEDLAKELEEKPNQVLFVPKPYQY